MEQSSLMIQKLLLNIQTTWLIFIKTWKIIIQIKKNNHKILIIFDYRIADMLCNKNLKPIATELLIRGRISFVFITQSYFAVAEDIILNFMDYFLMEIPNTIELKQFASQN